MFLMSFPFFKCFIVNCFANEDPQSLLEKCYAVTEFFVDIKDFSSEIDQRIFPIELLLMKFCWFFI